VTLISFAGTTAMQFHFSLRALNSGDFSFTGILAKSCGYKPSLIA